MAPTRDPGGHLPAGEIWGLSDMCFSDFRRTPPFADIYRS
jgi:hypothetical protein